METLIIVILIVGIIFGIIYILNSKVPNTIVPPQSGGPIVPPQDGQKPIDGIDIEEVI